MFFMGLYYCNPNHSTDAEFRLECIKREIANSTTILQKMRHEDVKDVFDCFDQNRPFKKDLNVQVILQDCGHKLSPPRLEFPVGYFLLLQNSNNKTKTQRKREAANQNPKEYINDPRVPSNLKSSILAEILPDLERGWSTSGPQLHPTEFPDLQQRYCSPMGQNDYSNSKGAALYTIATGNKKDDTRYRLLHVYEKGRKESNGCVKRSSGTRNRNKRRGQLQERPRAQKRVNSRKFKVAAKRISRKDHKKQLDSHLHERKFKTHIDQVCLEKPTHLRNGDFLQDPYFLQAPNLVSDFPVPPIEMDLLPHELEQNQAFREVNESWDLFPDFPVPPIEMEPPELEQNQASREVNENWDFVTDFPVPPIEMDLPLGLEQNQASRDVNESWQTDEIDLYELSEMPELNFDYSSTEIDSTGTELEQESQFLTSVQNAIKETEATIRNALSEVDESERGVCLSLFTLWAREKAHCIGELGIPI